MLYYKQAVADKENKSVITTEVKLMRFENETTAFMKTEALDKWTHNMAVQIAAFSKGVDEETRERLQSLRR